MRKTSFLKALAAACGLLLAPAVLPAQTAPEGSDGAPGTLLLRYPDVSRDKIAFSYAGDLWVVDVEGGAARRLTSHAGLELFPKLSPDGKWIAFTGEYSGTRQVHVLGVDGGEPRQLTFYNPIDGLSPRWGYDNEVLDWTPDGTKVLFRANRVPYADKLGRPYLVPVAGGMEEPLPMPESGVGSLSPDGTRYAYAPIFREFRTWKRHKGGRAQDVWVYDLARNTAERITDHPGTDNHPVWVGDTLFFTSDREHTLNLFAWDPTSRQARKVTSHTEYDVLWPSAGPGRIVYENGGALYLFDPAAGASRRVPVRVEGDLPQTLPYFKNVRTEIQSLGLSPTGKRAVVGARGEVFTVPAGKGEIRNLTGTPGIREMDPAWSPDGRSIAYLSDRTGEYEIWIRPAGGGAERRVTTDGDVWRFPPVWSPDGKKLAFGDKKRRLRWVEVASGRVFDVDTGSLGDIASYRWSPDSRYLAYIKQDANQLASIWVYSLDDRKAQRLTGELTNDYAPVFDPKGRYLYFLSDRDFNMTQSGFEPTYLYTEPTRVYVAVLAKDGPALFLPESDEEEPGGEAADGGAAAKGGAEGGADAAPAKPVRVRIDADGFEARVRAIPGPPGNFQGLAANDSGVFYLLSSGGKRQLKFYDLEQRKEEVVLDGIQTFELSADGKKLLYQQGDNYGIVDARPGQDAGKGRLALDKLEMKVVPREEWPQLFADAWRLLRDWFYDPGLHGVDWNAMRERYGRLVPHVAHREDLDFLLGELGGELSAGHVYVERPPSRGERVEGGLLGAEIEAHPSGYFRVAKIFPGENWHEDFRSPLTEPGVRVREGDFLLAVDGEPTKGVDNFYRLLENKADRVVTLRVSAEPREQGAREERVRPIRHETNLRYLDWVRNNARRVEKASGGRIGYIHLPDTSTAGNRELFRHFYPLANKEALILDDRWNGGGLIPDTMVGLLSRPLLNYWVVRGGMFTPTPNFVATGPKAVLINGQAGSGGDAFPYYFKKLGLGPLIGTRTWGGLIGLSGNPPLMDGGFMLVPTFRFLDTEGSWAVENEGVHPDVEVIDRPDLVAKGGDPSLEKAIAVLLDQLAKNPPKKVVVPPVPRLSGQ